MKRIPLTQGKETIVDDQDYDYLMQWKWRYLSARTVGYAVRTQRESDGETVKMMHYVIAERMGLKITSTCDHKDRNGLNNRQENLRPATISQNNANRRSTSKSGYRGVYWYPKHDKWVSQIRVEGKMHALGYFTDKVEAAKAYNKAAKKHFGEFARLNPIPGE